MLNEDSQIVLIHDELVPEKKILNNFCSELNADSSFIYSGVQNLHKNLKLVWSG